MGDQLQRRLGIERSNTTTTTWRYPHSMAKRYTRSLVKSLRFFHPRIPTIHPHSQIYNNTQRLFKGTIPFSSSTPPSTALLYTTFASYSLQSNQFWLFALDPTGQLYVCDLLCDVSLPSSSLTPSEFGTIPSPAPPNSPRFPLTVSPFPSPVSSLRPSTCAASKPKPIPPSSSPPPSRAFRLPPTRTTNSALPRFLSGIPRSWIRFDSKRSPETRSRGTPLRSSRAGGRFCGLRGEPTGFPRFAGCRFVETEKRRRWW